MGLSAGIGSDMGVLWLVDGTEQQAKIGVPTGRQSGIETGE